MIFQKSINKFLKIAFIPLIIIHIIVLENIRFTLWPEMVVYPYLINNDFSLYKDLINPYPPTLIIMLSALTKIVGYQPQIFLLFTWILIGIIDIILYQVLLKIYKIHFLSLISLIFFMIISISFGINGLWFDLVQTPFIIISLYYFIKFKEENSIANLNLSLILVITAIFIKQQALWLLLAYILILFFYNRKNTFKLLFKLYPALLFFIVLSIELIFCFYKTNSLLEFINWTLFFPFIKASKISGYLSLPTIKQLLPIIVILILSSPSIFYLSAKRFYLLPIMVSLLFFAYPRFDYFHLIPALAFISILIGLSINLILKASLAEKFTYLFLVIMIFIYVARFITLNISTEIRFFEPEIQIAANFISITTNKNEPLYILNGPDQIFPLSSRLPIKPWADEFPWYLENGNLQQNIVISLIKINPRFIVSKPYSDGGKFDLGSYRPQVIADYLDDNYQNYYQITKTLWLKKKV